MTDYETIEESNSRRPVELYKLETMDGASSWLYTSADFSISYDGGTYVPATISRSEIAYNNNLDNTTVSLRIGYLEDPTLEYIVNTPIDLMRVTIYKTFLNAGVTEGRVLFTGIIKDIKFQGNIAEAQVVGLEELFGQMIPRLRFSPRCNTHLFSTPCGLSKDDYKITATVTDINGLMLECDSLAGAEDGYFSKGYIEYGNYRTMITGQEGTTVYLRYPLPVVVSGTVSLYPGCDGDLDTCINKYSNLENFRGFPHIPLENPCLWT